MKLIADLILKNANIITGEQSKPRAVALAIKGDRILLVGADNEVDQVKGPETRIIDCRGKTLVAGFNDAHCHLYPMVRKLFSVDLSPGVVRSIKDIKEVIRGKVRSTPEGRWIRCVDYNEFYLTERRHPTRWDLDEVAVRHPVILTHRSLHAAVLNSLALEMVGIDDNSEEPPGGIIDRDFDTGEPNGILYEMGEYIRSKLPSDVSEKELEWGISEINQEFLSFGITSIGEASVSNNLAQWQTYLKLKKAGKLKSRVYMMAGMESMDKLKQANLSSGSGDTELKLGSLKIVLSEATGRLNISQKELNEKVLEASQSGFQVAIHAVERSSFEAAVSALEYTEKQLPQFGKLHRIEHGSECSPEIRSRLINLKVAVVSQPPFIYYSGERYLSQVPAEVQPWLYPFKSLLDAGIIVAGSSDSPVVPHNPLIGIYAAISRRTESGRTVLSEEAVSLGQALAMYTLNGARASLEDNIKGTLAIGKLADIVMLSADPLRSSPEMIKEIQVDMTIIGGEVAYIRKS
jgi:hypothetical protein